MSYNILIVDDNPEDLYTIRRILKNTDPSYEITEMGDESQALLYLKYNHVDCIILDYQLTVMTGLEFISEYRGREMIAAPIIFMTGQGSEEVAVEAMKLGADDYLVKKNLKGELLDRSIRYCIQRRTNENAEREHNEFLNLLMNTIPDPVYYKDREGRFQGCNRTFEELLGHRAGDIIGKTAFDFLPRELAETYSEKEDEVFGGHEIREYESVLTGPGGEKRYYIIKKVPYKNLKGDTAGLLGTMHDFTDRKRSEERIKASLQEKEVLLSEVHHRVKNNLQVVSSIINLQAQKIKDEEARKTFLECINQIKSMAMVHENLYKSRDFSSINYREYLKRLVKDLFDSGPLPDKKITYTVDCMDISLSLRKGIPCGLIVTELITNAFKHAFPGGKGEITVFFAKEGDGSYTLAVSDNGSGIPDGFSIEKSPTLGLNLVTILVKQLKGDVSINGGKGTKVTVTFPE